MNNIELDNLYMRIALVNGMRSVENFKVGVCVVDPNGKVIAMGHNSILLPNLHKTLVQNNNDYAVRYLTIELGIETALNDSNVDYKGSTVYATTYPTAYCAKEMVKKKIKRVVFYNDVRTDFHDNYYASTSSILQEGDVEISFFEAQDDRHPDYTENNDTKAIRLAANLVNLKEYTTYLIRRI
nr:uncharacterized protein LOC111418313 isoform X1 [Onthophagus taurus]